MLRSAGDGVLPELSVAVLAAVLVLIVVLVAVLVLIVLAVLLIAVVSVLVVLIHPESPLSYHKLARRDPFLFTDSDIHYFDKTEMFF